MSFWWTRGTVPLGTALAAVAAFALPANAQASGPMSAASPAASPGLAAEWWLAPLSAQQAWASAPERGAGVTVAVLSSGVDPGQQDLTGNVITGPDYTGSGRSQGSPFWGAEGTAVASLIAGHGHGTGGRPGAADRGSGAGTQGITGIAPRARILSVRVTLERDDPLAGQAGVTRRLPDAIARGIRYAVSHGATVIALPADPATLGRPGAPGPAAGGSAAGGSAAERAAVRYALARNVVLVAPAGDDGMSGEGTDYPAAYPGVIAVGATSNNGKLAPFSSTRSYVALTAPGSGLTVAAPGGQYATQSSTSLASALAAGVAALTRSRYPGLPATQVTQAMEHGAVPADPGRAGTGAGALNAAGTVTAAASAFSLIGNPMPNPAPAWSTYVNARGKSKADNRGLLDSPVLRDAAAGAGVLIVVLVLILVFASRRRRREESRANARLDDALRNARLDDALRRSIAAGGGYAPGHSARAQPRTPLPPAAEAPTPAISLSDSASARASAVDALLSRNTRAILPPWEVANRLESNRLESNAPETNRPEDAARGSGPYPRPRPPETGRPPEAGWPPEAGPFPSVPTQAPGPAYGRGLRRASNAGRASNADRAQRFPGNSPPPRLAVPAVATWRRLLRRRGGP